MMNKYKQALVQSNTGGSTLAIAVLLLSAAGVSASPALAQTAAAPAPAPAPAESTSSDIIVTATRQSQTAQRVPIALTAVGAQQLADQGVTSAAQLSQLSPSLYVLSSVSDGSPRFTLRGLTFSDTQANGSPAVATYIDDVYQSFQFGVYTALFDLQRVEILRGPQGTTFGRNTTGGAVAYFNQTPTNKAEGWVAGRVAGGDQSQRYIEGVINVPLIDDKLALRISARADSKGNYVDDSVSGRSLGNSDSQTGRIQLRYTPSSDTSVNLTVFGLRRRGAPPLAYGQSIADPTVGSPDIPVSVGHTTLTPGNYYDNFNNYGATLRIEQSLGEFSLTSITHYRKTKTDQNYDLDGFPFEQITYFDRTRASQVGQEVRISSDPTRRLSGILGGYFEHDKVYDQLNYTALQGGGSPLDGPAIYTPEYNIYIPYTVKTTAYAAFANVTFKVFDSLSVIGGIRKSIERKTLDGSAFYLFGDQTPGATNFDWNTANIRFGTPPITPNSAFTYTDRQKAKPVTWDATINYNPDRNLLIFARIAKGFRSGGFNPPPAVFNPNFSGGVFPNSTTPAYSGETVKSYEAGIKATLLDNKLRVNLSGFHYDYTDQQITEYINFQAITTNAGASKVDGGELELVGNPFEGLDLRGSVAYADTRYVRYTTFDAFGAPVNYKGNSLIQAPKWTLNGSINYKHPLTDTYDLTTNATASYRSKIYFNSANSAPLAANGLTLLNFRLGFEPSSGKGLSAVAFVNNITNRRPLASGVQFTNTQYLKFFDVGRVIGVDVSYHW